MKLAGPSKERSAVIRKHASTRLRLRLVIYLIVALALAGFVAYSTIMHGISVLAVLLGLAVGLGLGGVASRMYKISWNDTSASIIGKMDIYGIIILVLYIAFEIFRSKIVAHFVQGSAVSVVSFAVLSGVMYGRVLGIRGSIFRVLKEQNIKNIQ